MDADTKADVLKRLAYLEGHLAGVRRMVESDTYCVDVLKQTYAVRRAIEQAESRMLSGHLHHCVVDGVRGGEQHRVIEELVQLYELANK